MSKLEIEGPKTASARDFARSLARAGYSGLDRQQATTLQVNLGRRCNQACVHCHVEAGPRRTEEMDLRTARRVLELLKGSPEVTTLDLTGGAPELNAVFEPLVLGARALGRAVMDRCNLTVLFEPEKRGLAEFLAANHVAIVASLPCYTADNTDEQRGKGTFEKSIEALRWLNRLGYAQPGSPLGLDLVYNPSGPSLPPPQAQLEAEYREELWRRYRIRFDRLFALTNMPIKRFSDFLRRRGGEARYLELLAGSFNPETVPALMCRTLVSVGYRGELYDCDFNQMLDLPLGGRAATIWDVESISELTGAPIATGSHCFGCTAGAGSSCGGTLST